MGVLSQLDDLEARLDRATSALLPPLRATKRVDSLALVELLEVTDGFSAALHDCACVPRPLVGKLWFVFTAMLTEADHAREPEPILDAAWNLQERLRKIFGPTF